jgi:hypothetical protein
MSQASVTPPGYAAAGYQQDPARSLVNPMWAVAGEASNNAAEIALNGRWPGAMLMSAASSAR